MLLNTPFKGTVDVKRQRQQVKEAQKTRSRSDFSASHRTTARLGTPQVTGRREADCGQSGANQAREKSQHQAHRGSRSGWAAGSGP